MKTSSSKLATLQQKFLPASTPIPNWVFDEVMAEMPEFVLKVFLYLFRKTVGWNNQTEEQSLTQIMSACNIGSRHTAVYAVEVLCDCWLLWKKTRGRKGQHSSVFAVAGIGEYDQTQARIVLTECIYGSSCPTRQQLKDTPPTERLYQDTLTNEINKFGSDWWVAKASTQWFPESTSRASSGSLSAPVEVL